MDKHGIFLYVSVLLFQNTYESLSRNKIKGMTKPRECRGDVIKMRQCLGAPSSFMMEANAFPTRIRPKKLFWDKL